MMLSITCSKLVSNWITLLLLIVACWSNDLAASNNEVNNTNTAPRIVTNAVPVVDQDRLFYYTIQATDAENDLLTWSINNQVLPAGFSLKTSYLTQSLAGDGQRGFAEGQNAQFAYPESIAVVETQSNTIIYIADTDNHRIRKITKNEQAITVETIAGTGIAGNNDGELNEAQFNFPRGLTVTSNGTLYVTDNNRVRRIVEHQDGATVTTLIGNESIGFTDGNAASAKFKYPQGISHVTDSQGNTTLYVADTGNNSIRKITNIDNAPVVSTLAGKAIAGHHDGLGFEALFNYPQGVAATIINGTAIVYVADSNNNQIRKITDDETVTVTTIAGTGKWGNRNGLGEEAEFDFPNGISVSTSGNVNTLFVADSLNHSIRKVVDNGVSVDVSTLAGNSVEGFANGTIASAQFSYLQNIVASQDNTKIYAADSNNNRISESLASGLNIELVVEPLVENVGTHDICLTVNDSRLTTEKCLTVVIGDLFDLPSLAINTGLFISESNNAATITNNMLLTDDANSTAEQITYTLASVPENGSLTLSNSALTLNSTFTQADINNSLLVYGRQDENAATDAFEFTVSDHEQNTLTGLIFNIAVNHIPLIRSLPVTSINEHNVYNYLLSVIDGNNPNDLAWSVSNNTSLPSFLSLENNTQPTHSKLLLDGNNNNTQTSDLKAVTEYNGNKLVIDGFEIKRLQSGILTTVAGSTSGHKDGHATEAQFTNPTALTTAQNGTIYVADANQVRKLTLEDNTYTVSTIITDEAGLASPQGITVVTINNQNVVYVADTNNNRIVKVVDGEEVTHTVVEFSNQASPLNAPQGIAAQYADNQTVVYVADTNNNLIRKISEQTAQGDFVEPEAPVDEKPTDKEEAFGGSWGDDDISGSTASDGTWEAAGSTSSWDDDASDSSWNTVSAASESTLENTNNFTIETIAGTGENGFVNGAALSAQFSAPSAISIANDGTLYVLDNNVFSIRKITHDNQVVTLTEINGQFTSLIATAGGTVAVTNTSANRVEEVIFPGTSLTGTPTQSDIGTHNVCLTVTDGINDVEQCFDIVVHDVNDQPTVTPVTLTSVSEDSAAHITNSVLLTNAIDTDGDTLTITNVTLASGQGELAINEDAYTFTPAANWHGTVTLNFIVTDGLHSVENSASLTIDAVNDAPTASHINLADIAEDNSVTITKSQLKLGTHDIEGDTLTVQNLNLESGQGTVTAKENGNFIFTPVQNWNGNATFTYTITDGQATITNTAALTVTAVNDAPHVVSIELPTVNEDNAITFTAAQLLAGASDEEGNTLTIANLSLISKNGALVSNTDGSFTFTPEANWSGEVSFSFDVTDGEIATHNTAALFINAVNDAPHVIAIELDATDEDTSVTVLNSTLLTGATDTEGDTLTITNLTLASGQGRLNTENADSFTFTPEANWSGDITFEFAVTDGEATTQNTATLIVNPVNDAPVTENASYTVLEGQANISIELIATDIDSDDLTFSFSREEITPAGLTLNTNGILDFNPQDPAFDRASEGEEQTFTVSFYAVDSEGASAAGEVSITLIGSNDTPIANDAELYTEDQQTVSIELSELVTDIDTALENLIFQTEEQSENGIIEIEGDVLTYTPHDNFEGEDTISISIVDGQFTVIANVSIEVVNTVQRPDANEENNYEFDSWNEVVLDVLNSLGTAPEGELVSARSSIGEITIENNQLLYTPQAGQIGDVEIEYTYVDTNGQSVQESAVFTFDVTENYTRPVISVPADLCGDNSILATGRFTKVTIDEATARDGRGNTINVELLNASAHFTSGRHLLYWQATDAQGLTRVETQEICIEPMISFAQNVTVQEGNTTEVTLNLSGEAVDYPVEIPVRRYGYASDTDYTVSEDTFVIESGTQATITFTALEDNVAENNESVIFSLAGNLHFGANRMQTVTITENLVAPSIELSAIQGYEQTNRVLTLAGNVTINSTLLDNADADDYIYSWTTSSDSLVNTNDSGTAFTFFPGYVTEGTYRIELTITHSEDNTVSSMQHIYVHVARNQLALSADTDSDGDNIPDSIEGFGDQDNDGTPDYLDAIDSCDMLAQDNSAQSSYVIETSNGVCIQPGNTAVTASNDGALLDESELENDDSAVNVGGMFDFVVSGINNHGSSVEIVIPQRMPVPAYAVYRKFKPGFGWNYFVEDNFNTLASAPGEAGYCPSANSDAWQSGLTSGHWCVKLTIQDGGPNDDDGAVNGNIVDPGYIGILATDNNVPTAQDSHASVYVSSVNTISVAQFINDLDGDTLTIEQASATFGQVEIVNNEISYTATNYQANDEIIFIISDTSGATVQARVYVEVIAQPNSAPTLATIDAVTVELGLSTPAINVLNGAVDADGDTVSIFTAEANNGDVIINGATITYTANINFTGTDTVTYTVEDSAGNQAIASFDVNVVEGAAQRVAEETNEEAAPQQTNVADTSSASSSGGGSIAWFALFIFALVAYRTHAAK